MEKNFNVTQWTIPNVELIRAFFVYSMFKFKWTEPLLFSYRAYRKTHRPTDGHDKQQNIINSECFKERGYGTT